jgi:hypothetical protein
MPVIAGEELVMVQGARRAVGIIAAFLMLFFAAATGRAHAEDSAPSLSADVTAKARDLKQADISYLKALCDGSKAERVQSRDNRAGVLEGLNKAIANDATLTPEVQKLLDVAADAGVESEKIAANTQASDKEKADALGKFNQARLALREAVTKEKDRIAAQIGKDVGVSLAAREECPDAPKAAEENRSSRKVAREQPERRRAAPSGGAAEAPAPKIAIGVGGGGIGIGIGGVGVTFGR